MKARLGTSTAKARSASRRWDKQYRGYESKEKTDIGNKLRDLGKSPSFRDVERITGNKSWTTVTCSGCNKTGLRKWVVIGEVPDWDSSTVFLCFDCVKDAMDKFLE